MGGLHGASVAELHGLNEPPCDKTNQIVIISEDSAWASAQSDQSSLSAWKKLGSLATHWAHSEDPDQTGRMPRLIRVFADQTGRTNHFVGFVMRWLKFFIKISQSHLSLHYCWLGCWKPQINTRHVRKTCCAQGGPCGRVVKDSNL